MDYCCDVCGQKVSADLMVYKLHTEKHIVDLVKHDHPDWIETNGLCQKCFEYYQKEIQGSVFKDAVCALRIRKTKNIFQKVVQLWGGKK